MRQCLATGYLVLIVLSGSGLAAEEDTLSQSFFSDMIHLRDSTSARISSYDRTGANHDVATIPPKQTFELATIPDAGCIRHLYFTILGTEHYLRNLVLRMYWDGETQPSVETPFGDFFGLGHERPHFFQSLMVSVNPGTGLVGTYGFNCYFPMPFAKGARLTLTNEGVMPVGVWYHVDYEKLDQVDESVGRFHAYWHRENPTTAVGEEINVTSHGAVNLDGKENYVILDATGHGNLAGYFLNIDNVAAGQGTEDADTWYGEGDDMIFIDGEVWPPSFHGTGSEEIFGGGACPNNAYAGLYSGFHLIGNRDYQGKVSMYRFFVADPIRFRNSIRVTIEHGHANNMTNDYSSCVFWYQAEPHAPFPPLLKASERRPRKGTTPDAQAYKALQRLHNKTLLALSSLSVRQIQEALPRQLQEAFEAQDYEAAIEECRKGIARLAALQEAQKSATEK